ncbi:MAG: hypothetical protein IJ003_06665 [Candidatus Gastranaerophilales bacterium]|nr:hypothetical protein [Candidatus Gastranaerophilales bacterium]
MNKKIFSCKKNKERISFTKEFKRRALIELSKGKTPEDILNNATHFDIKTSDKKYYSKLMHKWRCELYKNSKFIAFNSITPSIEDIKKEIEDIGEDEEFDEINEMFKKRLKEKQKKQ